MLLYIPAYCCDQCHYIGAGDAGDASASPNKNVWAKSKYCTLKTFDLLYGYGYDHERRKRGQGGPWPPPGFSYMIQM